MWRLIKTIFFLTLFAAIGLIAYAYAGPIFFPADFAPPVETITQPVELDTN